MKKLILAAIASIALGTAIGTWVVAPLMADPDTTIKVAPGEAAVNRVSFPISPLEQQLADKAFEPIRWQRELNPETDKHVQATTWHRFGDVNINLVDGNWDTFSDDRNWCFVTDEEIRLTTDQMILVGQQAVEVSAATWPVMKKKSGLRSSGEFVVPLNGEKIPVHCTHESPRPKS